jgi:CubicO group peptidase (beta-lactamase class C family)
VQFLPSLPTADVLYSGSSKEESSMHPVKPKSPFWNKTRIAGRCAVVGGVLAGCVTASIPRVPIVARNPASDFALGEALAPTVIPSSLMKVLSGENDGVNTDAVLIVKDGDVLFETYRRGYDASKKHLSWSMAKSIAGILVAQAVAARRIGYDDPVAIYLPEFRRKDTRIRDVLQMSSGIEFKEEYSGIPVTSDATRMLYLRGPKTGFGAYVAGLSPRADANPGEHFYYSGGDTNLLMEILRRDEPSREKYNRSPFETFFEPLGITDVAFEQDSKGTFVGSSYVYLTLRDYARIGSLLMNEGVGPTGRVIPESYFDLMNEVAPGVQKRALPGTSQTRAYSSHITTNRPITSRSLPSEYADLPTDALLMIGHQGQLVVASPSQKLVIVRLAMDKGSAFDRKAFFQSVVELIRANGKVIVTARDERPGDYAIPTTVAASGADETAGVADYLKVPQLIRALAAKEYCSCIYLTARTAEECKADMKVSLPVLPRITHDAKQKTIRTVLGTGLAGKASIAAYRGPRLGCTLVVSE